MARIRYIKPGFFTNEDLAELPFEHRLAFAGLWSQADREGRLEDRPKRLKAAIFPYDPLDMEALLVLLERKGFIRRYAAQGRPLIDIPTFLRHQRPRNDEPPSELPPWEARDRGGAPSGLAPAPTAAEPAPSRQERPNGGGPAAPAGRADHAAVTDPSLHSDGPASGARGTGTHQRIGNGELGTENGERGSVTPRAHEGPRRVPIENRQAHKSHAHCGLVCVPGFLHAEFRQALNRPDDPDGVDDELVAGYMAHCAAWPEGQPTGDPVSFWRAWFKGRYPPPTAKQTREISDRQRRQEFLRREGIA